MNGRKAKLLRKENAGQIKAKQLFAPFTVEIKGVETYIPRRERRAVYRKYMTMLRKGKITLQELIEKGNK